MELVLDAKWIYFPKKGKLVKDGRVIIENKVITYSGKQKGSDNLISNHNRYTFPKGMILPGFVNAHTHIPETLLRGLCDDADLQTWLYDVIWKVEPNLKAEEAYWGTMLGIADMLSTGTVGFNDQYFYSDQISKSVSETGIKAKICPSIFFKGNPEAESMEEALSKAVSSFKKWNGHNERLWIGLGPHAPYTVDKDWFEKIAHQAKELGTGLHTHLNETQYEIDNAQKEWGMRPIEFMDKIGALEVIDSAAHCIFLSDKEISLLKKYNVSVLHCPKSNLKIGAGVANVPELLKAGVNVCLGTDGQASNNKLDIIEEMALEALLHKGVQSDPLLMPSSEVVKMVTSNASQLFPQDVYAGTLVQGTKADIAVLDFNRVETTPIINPISHLSYAIGRQNVVMTIVDGTILYENGNYPTIDTSQIKKKCQQITNRLMLVAYGEDWEHERIYKE